MTPGKNLQRAQHYNNPYKPFPQVSNVSLSSTQRQIFVIARVFDIVLFDNILQKRFDCIYHGSTLLPTRIIQISAHWTFICLKPAIETLEQGVKFVKS